MATAALMTVFAMVVCLGSAALLLRHPLGRWLRRFHTQQLLQDSQLHLKHPENGVMLHSLYSLRSHAPIEVSVGGETMPIEGALRRLIGSVTPPGQSNDLGTFEKFAGSSHELVFGPPQQAALGMAHTLRVAESTLAALMAEGTAAIVREVEASGTAEDKECLDYVLRCPAGSSSKRFPNGVRDANRSGEMLADFMAHPSAVTAELTEAEMVALRLYTTAAYKSLNAPCRDLEPHAPAHPLPATVSFLALGIKKLRAVGAKRDDAQQPVTLWRGLRDLQVGADFTGGTELGCMSTSASAEVAMRYALEGCATRIVCLFRLQTASFMERGADLAFLSAFPDEAEYLYPPSTYLRVLHGRRECLTVDEMRVTVIDLVPTFPT